MEQVFERPYMVAPSVCDFDGRLSIPGAFSLFMDLATEHAERLGVGLSAMQAKNRFWLTVKTRIAFEERPAISEAVRLLTWPEKPGPLRFNRSYELWRGDRRLISGRTEWAVLNTETGALAPSRDIFPEGIDYGRGSALEEGFARVPDRFDGAPFAEYRVRSADIDLGGHMNNAAYPRALFGAFAVRELREKPVRCVDLIFRAPCHEGDLLSFYKKEEDGRFNVRMARGEETVLLGQITF